MSELEDDLRGFSYHPQVVAYLKKAKGPFVVSLSGGVDSVFLLYAVRYILLPNAEIVVGHYNHKIRGEHSDKDAQYVKDLCNQLGVQCVVGEYCGESALLNEEDARNARLEFFDNLLKEKGATCIFQGHHSGDVSETILMRLARGVGTSGLVSPRPIQFFSENRVHLRPLLHLNKQVFEEVLTKHKVHWRQDESNNGDDFLRNRMRHNVLPNWIEADEGRDVMKGVLESRQRLEEDSDALTQWSNEIVKEGLSGNKCTFPKELPISIVRRVLKTLCSTWGIRSYPKVPMDLLTEAIVEKQDYSLNIEGEGTLGWNSQAILNWEPVLTLKEWRPVTLELNTSIEFSTIGTIKSEVVAFTEDLKRLVFSGKINNTCNAYVKTGGKTALEIRSWKAGDRYCKLGASGTAKVQDHFVNHKIAKEVREYLPIFLSPIDQQIIWVPGLPIAENWKLSMADSHALRLTFQPTIQILNYLDRGIR